MQLRIAPHCSRLAWLVGSALAVASLAGMTGCDLQENADKHDQARAEFIRLQNEEASPRSAGPATP